MILTLDFVANRYGMLPSQLLRMGDSLDIIIADTAQTYRNKLQAQENGEIQHNLSEEEMLAMIAGVQT